MSSYHYYNDIAFTFLIKPSQRCIISHLYILLAMLMRDEGKMMWLSETSRIGDKCNTDFICYIVRQCSSSECNYAAETRRAGAEMGSLEMVWHYCAALCKHNLLQQRMSQKLWSSQFVIKWQYALINQISVCCKRSTKLRMEFKLTGRAYINI